MDDLDKLESDLRGEIDAAQDLRALDDIVKDFLNTKAAAPQLGSEKGISDAIRDGLGISLTNAETKRVFKYVCSKEFSRNHQGGPPVNF